METRIMKVKQVGQMTTFTSQKAEVGTQEKRQVVLQSLGGDHEDAFVATAFGLQARQPVAVGDIVAAKLAMLTHEYQGQVYQDCIAREIVPIKTTPLLPD